MHKKGFGTIENVDKTERNNKQKTSNTPSETTVYKYNLSIKLK